MIYQLVVCIGVYYGSCGTREVHEFAQRADCFDAVKAFRFYGDHGKRGAIAFCIPKKASQMEETK